MKDNSVKEKFVELRASGMSFDKISKELNVSKQSLITWVKEFETEIGNLRKIELEFLQEKYFMLKNQRIELFGEKLKAIKGELDKRDLSEVPTAGLYDLFLKIYRQFETNDQLTFCGSQEPTITFNSPCQWRG